MLESGSNADIKVGNALQLKNIPVGTHIHNIEMKPGKGVNLPERWKHGTIDGKGR